VVRRPDLVRLAAALWLLRWAAQELAAYAGRHWQRPGPPPRDSPRRPGWMPGPRAKSLQKGEKA
jgi:hypothetical protein